MKQKHIFLYNFIFFILFLSNAIANQTQQNYLENQMDSKQKMYVNSNDLLIIENGLYLNGANGLIGLHSIETDEHGFFVIAKSRPELRPKKEPTCINGHPIYHKECGGCANWWCNSRCKCYSPW